jgi:ribonuclease BN (tRNA processing enzyme)
LSEAFQDGNESDQRFWEEVLSPREYDPGEPLTVGSLTLRFAPMPHYIPVWAIRVEERATGRALTYSADTGPGGPLATLAAGSDLLLCEATLLQPNPEGGTRGHLAAAEAVEARSQANLAAGADLPG